MMTFLVIECHHLLYQIILFDDRSTLYEQLAHSSYMKVEITDDVLWCINFTVLIAVFVYRFGWMCHVAERAKDPKKDKDMLSLDKIKVCLM